MTISTPELVLNYIDQGFAPIPVKFKSKEPINKGWTDLAISKNNIADYFRGEPTNIGILTGERSGGLVDVDIDNIDALKFAEWFLPDTDCVFGRESKPKSHRVYRVPDTGRRETYAANGMIAEIRGNRCCTVFPGSVHPSGERVAFENSADYTPGQATWSELKQAVKKIAIATVLHQCWSPGCRHELALSATAFLARQGWSVEEVIKLIEAVATEALDEEVEDRLRCVETTFAAYGAGRAISGNESLFRLVGADIVPKLRRWSSAKKECPTLSAQDQQYPVADLTNDAAAADAFAAAYEVSV
jgi:hypothetical protein